MIQYNGQTLAYIGDAVYELFIREKLLASGNVKPNDLHHEAIGLTNANAQYSALKKIEDDLDPEEQAVVMRGRNATSSKKPKKATLQTYKLATGFEALLGYLYLTGKKERLHNLLEKIAKEAV